MRPPQRSRTSRIVTALPARASSRAAIRPAAPAPTMTICSDVVDISVLLLAHGLRIVLDQIAQKQDAAAEIPRALQRHRAQRCTPVAVGIPGIEYEGRALGAIDGRAEDQVEFVNQAGTQERAVGDAPALHQQALYTELAVEDVQRQREVDLGPAAKDIGHAPAAEPREM